MAQSLRAHVWALAILAVLGSLTNSANGATTTLQLLAQATLPTIDNKGPGTEQVVFDDGEKVAYLVGGSTLYVVDMSQESLQPDDTQGPARALSVLQTLTLPTTVNDLSFCANRQGGYLAVSANGGPLANAEDAKVLPGSVTLFGRYLRAGGPASLQQLAQFIVGALPDQLEFSRDCRTILVSNEGEPKTYSPASLANDPEGSVSVINLLFCGNPYGAYAAAAAVSQSEGRDDGAYAAAAADVASESEGASADKYAVGEKEEAVEPERHAKHPSHSPYSGKTPYPDRPYDAPHKYDQPSYYRQHGPYDPSRPPSYPEDPYPSYPHNSPECTGGGVYGRVRTARFTAWNSQKALLESQGVKLNGINATVAQDLEPEYTAFSADEKTAFVTLQENNAVAVLDVERAVITSIHALGWKDHSAVANPFDPSDQDGPSGGKAPLIRNWPVFGIYQPDEMRSFRFKGADYIVTANEGDARQWTGLDEERRGSQIASKAAAAFSGLFSNDKLGRLTMLAVNGNPYPPYSDPTNTGNFTRLFAFGARSFSIWRLDKAPNGDASLVQVFDSADQLEQISLAQTPDLWNSELGNVANATYDGRSDNKGPEPEGVAIGPCSARQRTRPYGDADPAETEHYRREGTQKPYYPRAPENPYPRAPESPYYRREPETPYYPRNPESPYYYRGEPEQERLCLFLGTERLGVVFVYDISDPHRPVFQSVARPPTSPTLGNKALSGPEGLTYARYTVGYQSYSLVLVAYEADTSRTDLPAGLGVYLVTEQA